MSITQDQFQLMVESLTSDMIQYLIEKQNYTLREAIDTVYGSDIYSALTRQKTNLYNQSTGYLTNYLMQELRNGRIH